MKALLWATAVSVIIAVRCESDKKNILDICAEKNTCSSCIQTRTCAWCSDPKLKMTRKRCFSIDSGNNRCRQQYIYSPESEKAILENKTLRKGSKRGRDSSENDVVQLFAQRVDLKLRLNEKMRLKLQYAQAEDYPVDIYYLMDLSKSMRDDIHLVSNLGISLAEEMRHVTSDLRLGFGSFVDKVIEPFAHTDTIDPSRCHFCVPPYAFWNMLPLTTNTSLFKETVLGSRVSPSHDRPEGGFDGLMQAIVCHQEIGWRHNARRILVYSSDGDYHFAGDGRIVGIIEPNDGLCHLNATGHYTNSLITDYPSISQINSKVKENSINLVFAVTAAHVENYKKLAEFIEGSYTAELARDSSNIVKLLKEEYNKISSGVELKDNSTGHLKLTYFSKCLKPDGSLEKTNKCDGLKVGSLVEFEVDIEAVSCPTNRSETYPVHIYPVGINESLVINLEILCGCPCESEATKGHKEKADECSGHGTHQCGVCKCDEGHSGPNCQCGENRDDSGCRPDNTTQIDCSGRGTCVCGQCICDTREGDEVIEGDYCECDNFSCDRENGELCSGTDHGICQCGKCLCKEGWADDSCSCPTSVDACVPPGGGPVCSGRGICSCGVCMCTGSVYGGRYCERCPGCPGQCDDIKDCVECMVYQSGRLTAEECSSNCSFVLHVANGTEMAKSEDEYLCRYYDEHDCKFSFVYGYDTTGERYVVARKDKVCPTKAYTRGIIIGVITTIVLIGLATAFVWKFLTTIHDRRGFVKLERERNLSKSDAIENPLTNRRRLQLRISKCQELETQELNLLMNQTDNKFKISEHKLLIYLSQNNYKM